MAKLSKRQKAAREKLDRTKLYPVDEAMALLKDLPKAKFVESIDAAINLGVDPRKSDQVVRGSTVLPHGTGKTVRVAVFAQGENADKPGGAFQAGSVLGAAGVLLRLAGWRPQVALMALPLRLVLIIGPAAFVAMALVTLLSEGQLLTYPVGHAGVLIFILEAAATLSIGVTLAALFFGGKPQDEQRK